MRANTYLQSAEKDTSSTNHNFFNGNTIFPKLTINAPNDKYEQEADAMATKVMTMPESGIQRKCAACEEEEESIQKQEMDESPSAKAIGEGEEEMLQTKSDQGGMQASPALQNQLNASKGGGSPLPENTSRSMSNAFGADFSGVRVHTGQQANDMNQGIQAKAFTHGSDIYFRNGQYNPGSSEGKQLLAHELTHVVQQGGTRRNIQRQLLDCTHLLANPSQIGLISGTAAHAAIAAEFGIMVTGATNIAIPGGSATPLRSQGICGRDSTVINPQIVGGRSGMGFPDLARRAGNVIEIAEVKPAAYECVIDGEEQLARYITNSNATDPGAQSWRESLGIEAVIPMLPSTFTPISISTGNVTIIFDWCTPGLIAYSVRVNNPDPIPHPIAVPEAEGQHESNWEKITEFVHQLIKSGTEVEVAIREFLLENRELIDFVIWAGVGLIIATIGQDILSAGVGIIDDFVIIPIATAMIRIAHSLRNMAPVAAGLAPVIQRKR